MRVYEQILHLLNGSKTEFRFVKAKSARTSARSPRKTAAFTRTWKRGSPWPASSSYRHEYENAHGDIEFARPRSQAGKTMPIALRCGRVGNGQHPCSTDVKPRLAAARTLLEKAFAIDPTNVQVGLYLADIQSKQGERALAIETLRKTAQAFGPIKDSYWVLIDYAIDLQNSDLSTSLLERASAGGREDPRLVYFRGRLALLNGDYMKARALLRRQRPTWSNCPSTTRERWWSWAAFTPHCKTPINSSTATEVPS